MDNNTIPPSNVDLSVDYHNLRKACISSFFDECVNLKEDFDKISVRYEDIKDSLTQYSTDLTFVNKSEAEILYESTAIQSSPECGKSQDETETTKNNAGIVGQQKPESRKTRAENVQNAYKFILDCIELSARIQKRRVYWKQFGVEEVACISMNEETLADAQKKYNGTTLIQQALMLEAQEVFILAKGSISKAFEIEKALLRAVTIFKAKNILKSNKN